MTTLTEDKSKAIPQRNDIEEKDKWNLKAYRQSGRFRRKTC